MVEMVSRSVVPIWNFRTFTFILLLKISDDLKNTAVMASGLANDVAQFVPDCTIELFENVRHSFCRRSRVDTSQFTELPNTAKVQMVETFLAWHAFLLRPVGRVGRAGQGRE